MTCREILDFLMSYLDGELPPDEQRVFEGHLGECPACVAYLDTYRHTVRLVMQADEPDPCAEVPEDLVRAILAARSKHA
jgi:anti-sigma factor RsiW